MDNRQSAFIAQPRDYGGQMTEDGRPRTEERSQMSEVSDQNREDNAEPAFVPQSRDYCGQAPNIQRPMKIVRRGG
jgi:hypothetical protein